MCVIVAASRDIASRARVFVTVGTTSFDALIHAATTPEFANALEKLGFDELRLQVGRGAAPTEADRVSWFRFAPTITEEMRAADVVISHAGAGSILEALELGKRLVVCVNDALMDNHQSELAGAMARRGHLHVVNDPDDLRDEAEWRSFEGFSPRPFSGGDDEDFPRLLDSRMGFAATSKDE